jgi:two-component system response regulator AtoC
LAFTWPGNVRQLENMIKQVVVRGDDSIITDLITSSTMQPVGRSFPTVPQFTSPVASRESDAPNSYSLKARINTIVAEEEKRVISEVLNKTNWNRRKAADLLEISYRSLLYKIKDYNLNAAK